MRQAEKKYPVTMWFDKKTFDAVRRLAEEDVNSVEYELRIAVRKGLEQLTGERIDEDE